APRGPRRLLPPGRRAGPGALGQGLLAHRRQRRAAGAYFFLNRSLTSAKVTFRASLRELAAFLVCSPTSGFRTASPRALKAWSSDSVSFCRASSTLRRSAGGPSARGSPAFS